MGRELREGVRSVCLVGLLYSSWYQRFYKFDAKCHTALDGECRETIRHFFLALLP